MNSANAAISHDPYRALRFRDFRLLFIGTFVATLGEQMLAIAIGWELYDRTGSALALGGVGLAQIFPVILLTLPAGYVADRFNRKQILLFAQLILAICSLGLMVLSALHSSLILSYVCLFVIGGATAFV